jgi:quinol monooxygenase YgiN
MAVTYFVRMRALEGREAAVRDLLLSNVERIDAGERGNVVFAVHASNQDPREFWLYETWTDAEAVEEHESGPGFKAYKDALRPLVEPDSLVFGDAQPLALRGYAVPEQDTPARRFVRALGTNDEALLDAIYDPDVVLYTPLAWPVRGRDEVKAFVAQFQAPTPGCA